MVKSVQSRWNFGLDEQTPKQGGDAEERFLRSFPFHPDLTEVLYSKWTALSRFQRTRGVLRMFALALREAEKWDTCPLVGPAVFLSDPKKEGLSEALREMVAVADTEESEGARQAWTGILDNEFTQARRLQFESVGLNNREIEQAVVATFLHSQPVGQNARTRDLVVLLGPVRPDKIELEKGLARWAQCSYWLDDLYSGATEGQLPGTWRLGNRPNLTQMHAVAAKSIQDEIVRGRLLDEIGKAKSLTANASAAGVRVHTLPNRPKDIEDDGAFHYAVLGPSAASESGKPSPEATRFLDETTGADKPRVYRNAVLLLAPSKDGLELALARVREYLAWEVVREEVKKQQKDGNVDPARAQTLAINIDKSKGRIPEFIKQAYCVVVTVSDKDEAQAFKITITEEPHFNIIKADKRSRVQDTAVTAEALLSDGPYNLWRDGETARRVKDLTGAFAQLPHLPKMLKANAILDTLVEGCEHGTFVLRLTRPDGTSRSWWMSKPDQNALNDPAMELVLPVAAVLTDIAPSLLSPQNLPGLWTSDEIAVQAVFDYFSGKTVVKVDRGGYHEPMQIPKAEQAVVKAAIAVAVADGGVWLLSGPASILGEPIPAGVLSASGKLCVPPASIAAAEILPENLKDAWQADVASGLSIATALSVKAGKTLPWKTVRDVITGALQARFLELEAGAQAWPCDFPSAQFVKVKVAACNGRTEEGGSGIVQEKGKTFVAVADLEPSQVQELGDIIPKLLDVKNKSNTQIHFQIKIEIGDGKTMPSADAAQKFNAILKGVKEGLQLR